MSIKITDWRFVAGDLRYKGFRLNSGFKTQTKIGKMFGKTAKEIGNVLRQLGLKIGKKPTEKAKRQGLVRSFRGWEGYIVDLWRVQSVVCFLNQLGMREISKEQQELNSIKEKFMVISKSLSECECSGTCAKCKIQEVIAKRQLKDIRTMRTILNNKGMV